MTKARRTVWHDKPICPVCGERVLRTQSHSSFAPTFKLYHFTCHIRPPVPTATKQPPQQEHLFDDPTPTNPMGQRRP